MACSRSWIVALPLLCACQPKEDSSENIFDSASSSSDTGDVSSSGTGPIELGPCGELIECAEAAADIPVTPLVGAYGPEGTCWAEFTQAQCWDDCTAQFAALSSYCDMGVDACCEGEGTLDLPATYRFDCVDIQGVGNADGTVIQAQILENTWTADIMNFKLNIMLELVERDGEMGTANLGIRSGIGSDATNLCSEETSQTEIITVDYAPGQVSWEPTATPGECSTMTTRTDGNTYDMALTADRTVYIYAQDTNTVTFNCTPDMALPDAVPIRAVEAQLSTNVDETVVAGTLTGCLVQTEAMALCSCLASCNNDGPGDLQTEGDCAGCPTGGVPLDELLGDVGTSDRCTGLVGAPAFDLTLGFTASLLPNVPVTCGS